MLTMRIPACPVMLPAALALALVLSGCASIVRKSPMVCNTGACMIPVDVVDCAITAPDIEVQGASRNLFWTLDPHSSYKFASNGIAIANNDGQFSGPGLNGSGKQFHWFDANAKANPAPYKYTVTIEGCATPLDPSIFNRG